MLFSLFVLIRVIRGKPLIRVIRAIPRLNDGAGVAKNITLNSWLNYLSTRVRYHHHWRRTYWISLRTGSSKEWINLPYSRKRMPGEFSV